MKLLLKVGLSLVGILGLVLAAQTKRVVGDDMAPSIQDGDVIFSMPTSDVLPGDVVLLKDPLNRNEMVLRRVLAVANQTVTVANGHIKVGKRRLRTAAMGDMGPYLVAKETLWAEKPAVGTSWLTRQKAEPVTHWKAEPVEVPEGHIYLIGDDRDRVLDSRWWGPVSTQHIQGVVRLRFGKAHTWRPSWEFLAGTPPIGA